MDSEFEPDLRAAVRREAYRPGFDLDAHRLRARLDADDRQGRARRRLGLVSGVAFASLAVVALGLRPVIQSAPSVGQATETPCVDSTPTTHGNWWVEIGGPHAYFNVKPGTLYAIDNPWLIIVRFDPDASAGETVAMSAEAMPSGQRVAGSLNSRMDPSNIYHFASPAPDLPGGWYLFEQRIPRVGCWRLTASIDGHVVGTAMVSITAGAPSPEPSRSPLPPTPRLASPTPTIVGSPH